MNAIADTHPTGPKPLLRVRFMGSGGARSAIALILLRISIHKSLKARKNLRLSGYARPYRVRG